MRDDVLVVGPMPPLQGDPTSALVVLLLLLLRPWEEEPASGALVEAVERGARVDVQVRLGTPKQEGPQEVLANAHSIGGIAARERPHKLCENASCLGPEVEVILHIHTSRTRGSCNRVGPQGVGGRRRQRDRGPWHVALRQASALVPSQRVRV